MTDFEERRELATALQEYADLEGTELGEVCKLLIRLVKYVGYTTKEFEAALTKELTTQLDNFKEQCEIVEYDEEIKRTIKVRELEWNY